jgi:hypothetical protein
MRLLRDATGISKIFLILLLVIAFIAGALFSYIYTMGYYAPFEFLLPDKPIFTIQSAEFSKQDTSFFDVTVVNPSYSQSEVNITRIEARTTDDNQIHTITSTVPQLHFLLPKGQSQTFRAYWNWANYTGIKLPYADVPVEIRVFLQDGRGATLELKRPLMNLVISQLKFNQSTSVNQFNVTVQNPATSETYVNITAFTIEGNSVPTDKVSPGLPCTLNPGDDPAQFQCFYNWTRFMNQNATVTVRTHQGYMAQYTMLLPKPVILNITQIVFNATIKTEFGINVTNNADSSTYVDINRITVTVSQQTLVNITQTSTSLPLKLDKNASILIICTWDWNTYAGQSVNVKIIVYTSQGFIVSKETQIP